MHKTVFNMLDSALSARSQVVVLKARIQNEGPACSRNGRYCGTVTI
jgi:hypothetical protein